MKQFNFDIKAAIHAQPNTLVSFGLEFRHPIDLEPLLSGHPHWQALKEILLNGATFPLRQISPEDRILDLNFHLHCGNHKSAEKHKEALDKIIDNGSSG
jgi:hypothetical protein